MPKIRLSHGAIKKLVECEKLFEDNASVPNQNDVDNEHLITLNNMQNFVFQITDIKYCDMYNVVWTSFFDGTFLYTGLLDESYWKYSESFLLNLKLTNEESTRLLKGDIILLEQFSFSKLKLCNNPFYIETYLKIKRFHFVPSDRSLELFYNFKLNSK